MKITFKPLPDPTPVRPSDMPEGVAFECYQDGQLVIRTRRGDMLYGVADSGIEPYCYGAITSGHVLRCRDGQPPPHSEPVPVPLDTLEPFPVWYPDLSGSDFFAHEDVGWIMCGFMGKIVDLGYDDAGDCQVLPTPYIMEVTP